MPTPVSGSPKPFAIAGSGTRPRRSTSRRSTLRLCQVSTRASSSIPNHERLLRELRGLERRVHRSGKDSVDHPTHGSDDHANVVCGALYMALHDLHKPQMRWGTFGGLGGGRIQWKDNKERERPAIRFTRVDEHGNVLSPEEAQAIRRGERRA